MNVRPANGLAAVTLLVAALACSDRKTPVPGKACLLNSDCDNGLSCTYGKCHEACRADGDCPGVELCVFAPETAGSDDSNRPKVCIDDHCSMNSDCADPLICGRDLRCRQECAANRDCPSRNQLCVIGNAQGQRVCAEPPDIADNGQLAPADGGILPPPPGDGGSQDDAPVSDAPVPPGDALPPPSDGATAHDAQPDVPVPPPDAGADAGPAMVTEREPNDDKGSAAPYTLGTEVAGTLGAGDGSTDLTDYYEVVVPATDPSGGYFQASVSGVGSGAVAAEVYSAFDNGRLLLADGADPGQDTFFFWAGRPGQHYLVRLYEAGAVVPTFDYRFKVTYTRIDDPSEPNDTSDTPARLVLGTPITAYFFAGFDSANPPVPDQDWYTVTLPAGGTTVSISPVPHDVRMQFQVYDANFIQLSATGAVGANPGAGLSGGFTVVNPGPHLIAISAFSFVAGSVAARGVMLPDSFTRAYTLKVTQP
jgi:hypothetical protein